MIKILHSPSPATPRFASVLTHSDNSGYAVRYRSPKPFRASHTRKPLYAMPALKMKGYYVIKGAKHEGENQKED